jgi:hypothetical protein
MPKLAKNNTTGVKGVTKNKLTGKYIANIRIGGVTVYLGSFNTLQEAENAMNQKENSVAFFNLIF